MKIFKDFKQIILQERILDPDVEAYLFQRVFVRKPIGFTDLDKASQKKMPDKVRNWVKKLPMITWKDLYGGVTPVKGNEFWEPHKGVFSMKTPQFFIVKAGAKKILMDTEGYDYPRFAAQLVA